LHVPWGSITCWINISNTNCFLDVRREEKGRGEEKRREEKRREEKRREEKRREEKRREEKRRERGVVSHSIF
jgi:hypothetical protein